MRGDLCATIICVVIVACGSADDSDIFAPAASSSADASAPPPCRDGAEGCACYGNRTCDRGLTCASDLCVDVASGGASGGSGMDGSAGNGGAPATGGLAGAAGGGQSECLVEKSICIKDPDACCLGLIGVGESGSSNCVCMPRCLTDADCGTGCCAPLDDGSASVCAPAIYCTGACLPAGSSCTVFNNCCPDSQCVYDDETMTTATCSALCASDAECVSGCCTPLTDGSAVCSHPSYCGTACLPVGSRPCGLGTECCPGTACISDAINQICLPLCGSNSECPSGCCAAPNGNGVYVCTDPGYCGI